MNGNNGNGGSPVYIDDECRKRWKDEELYKQEYRGRNAKIVLCVALSVIVIAGAFFLVSAGILVFPPVEIQNTVIDGDDNEDKDPIVVVIGKDRHHNNNNDNDDDD